MILFYITSIRAVARMDARLFAMRLIGRHSPISRATIDKYTEDIAVEGKRIQHELGFVPQYDLGAGWRGVLKTDPASLKELRRASD